MELVLTAAAGLFVGIGLGLAFGGRTDRRLLERATRHERILRERIFPAVERIARRLEIPVRSVPPLQVDERGQIVHTGSDAAEHVAGICEAITERESANSLALSDTVQLAKKDLGDVRKLRKA